MTTQQKSSAQNPPLPSVKDLCLSVPLYETFKFDNEKNNPFFAVEQYEGTLDFHCPECGRHSVFAAQKNNHHENSHYTNYICSLLFKCSRDKAHHVLFVFRAHKGVLQKIGQVPTLADLAIPYLRKYRQILGNERFQELSRAIGLTTHGVGVGAFVYLRRIFESLIQSARDTAATDAAWSEETYAKARMDEKIMLLKNHLPEFLVENRGLYGILSVGVHTLGETECLAAFPAVRHAIELILDDLLEQHDRQSKVKSAKQSLEDLKSSLGRSEAEV